MWGPGCLWGWPWAPGNPSVDFHLTHSLEKGRHVVRGPLWTMALRSGERLVVPSFP